MQGFRNIWRAVRDTFDHILPFMLGSIVWWIIVLVPLAIFTVIAASLPTGLAEVVAMIGFALGFGPATAVLAKWVDPRLAIQRPDLAEAGQWFRAYTVHAWIVAGWVALVMAVLSLNIVYYGSGENAFALLAPLWALLLIIATIVAFVSLAMVSLTDATPRQAFRRAGYVITTAPFQALLFFAFLLVISFFGTILVVVVVLFVPPLALATVDRLILNQLKIPIPDPNAPTDERLLERHTGADRNGRAASRSLLTGRRRDW